MLRMLLVLILILTASLSCRPDNRVGNPSAEVTEHIGNVMKVTIDRFEGDLAVAENEDGTSTTIEKAKLPKGAKVGDVLDIDGDQITVDTAETEARKKKVARLVEELFD